MNTQVDFCGVTFKNPIITASGTFGSGKEFVGMVDLNLLGGITVKGVSLTPWDGNPTPRVAETYGGMLNAVGLQNPGVHAFLKEDLPFLQQYDTKILVNICGKTIDEYAEVARILSDSAVDILELNISCPNVKEGGIAFGTNPSMAEKVVCAVKKAAKKPLVVKLSPNVTDITEIAKAAVSGGADALSLINTLQGMRIDINKGKPVLANGIGGLSGPAIKPVAVRMVYQVCRCVDVPVIGLGGVMNGLDAIEMMMAGASLVAIGTAHFHNPKASIEAVREIEKYMNHKNINELSQIRGIAWKE